MLVPNDPRQTPGIWCPQIWHLALCSGRFEMEEPCPPKVVLQKTDTPSMNLEGGSFLI